MKKFLLLTFCITNIFTSKAQSYLGFLTDNYAGVHGIISNPANIVDSRFKTDINLASVSLGATNDAFGVNVFDAFGSNFNFDKDAKKFFSDNNNVQTNVDILGPSFMFNLAPRHALAFSTRGRSIANVSNVNGEFLNSVVDKFDVANNFLTPAQNINIVGNAWAEFGLTYAAVLVNSDKNFFKAGFTVKYLSGLVNLFGNTNNVSVNYNRDALNTPTGSIVSTTGELTLGGVDAAGNVNTDIEFNKGTGFGADLGFIYEYRPNIDDVRDMKDKNKYLIKIGASLTDFGSIEYNNTNQQNYKLNGSFNRQEFIDKDIEVLLKEKYSLVNSNGSVTYNLPTSAHFNLDWNVFRKFYINANADYNINSKTAINTNTIGNNYSITPRIETKWFSLFVPLNIMEYSGFQAGAGMRLGPLFIGSGSIITNLVSDNSKAFDFYAGLKIPVYQGRIKDRDNDGIVDKKDDCPDEVGPIENKGCPYKDTDRDSVLDKDDKCPDVAGAADNQGCPYPDTDKDSVLDKDDKCINEAGPKENNGCPYLDSDKDGVLDKDDKCPTVFGIVARQGCPEEKKIVVEPVKVEVA